MQWNTHELLQALCRTFLHSLWQGMIVATMAGLVLLFTRRTSARIRYNLLGTLLLLFLITTGITFYRELPQGITPSPAISFIITAPSAPIQHPGDVLLNYLNTYAGMIMLIWLLIFLFKCVALMGGFVQMHRIRQQAQPVHGEWQQQVQRLIQQLGMQQQVRLLESAIVQIPLTLGFLKPCIYVPAGLLLKLPAEQVETILLHELAHIRRKDYFVNILQSFTDAVFFFNPALLWISARIREEREACCDDIVMAHTSHRTTYVHALLAFQEQSMHTSLGMALQGKHNYLYNRVKRMLTRENQKLNIMEKTILLASLVAITAFSLMPGLEQPATASPAPVQQQQDKWQSAPAQKKDKWEKVPAVKMDSKKAMLKKDTFSTKPKVKLDKWTNPKPAPEVKVESKLDAQVQSNVNANVDAQTDVNVNVDVQPKVKLISSLSLNEKLLLLKNKGTGEYKAAQIGSLNRKLMKNEAALSSLKAQMSDKEFAELEYRLQQLSDTATQKVRFAPPRVSKEKLSKKAAPSSPSAPKVEKVKFPAPKTPPAPPEMKKIAFPAPAAPPTPPAKVEKVNFPPPANAPKPPKKEVSTDPEKTSYQNKLQTIPDALLKTMNIGKPQTGC